MHAEPSRLVLAPAEAEADLEALIAVRELVHPDVRPTVETLLFNLRSKEGLVYLVGRMDGEPVACGFVEPWAELAAADVAVVPAHRRHGIGSAVLAEVRRRARALGKDRVQVEVRESEPASLQFVERRGFTRVGGEQAVQLDLTAFDAPAIDPPPGVRIASRVEEPDRLREMYAIALQADEDIPGSAGVQTFEQWRAHEIDKPVRRPELCFLALAGDEVVGYAALQAYGDEAHHGLTTTRRDWRRRGVASALKRAEIAAAKQAGFRRLVTESEERNEPMRRLNEKLGFVPYPELSVAVMSGPA